jgi:hypothetical protein
VWIFKHPMRNRNHALISEPTELLELLLLRALKNFTARHGAAPANPWYQKPPAPMLFGILPC